MDSQERDVLERAVDGQNCTAALVCAAGSRPGDQLRLMISGASPLDGDLCARIQVRCRTVPLTQPAVGGIAFADVEPDTTGLAQIDTTERKRNARTVGMRGLAPVIAELTDLVEDLNVENAGL